MSLENEKERSRRLIEQVLREKRKIFLEYLQKAIEIRLISPKEKYLEEVIALKKLYKFHQEIFRKLNLAVFTSEKWEVEELKKRVEKALEGIKIKERSERNE